MEPKVTTVEGDPDEDASAIDSLMSLLGHGSELQEEDAIQIPELRADTLRSLSPDKLKQVLSELGQNK